MLIAIYNTTIPIPIPLQIKKERNTRLMLHLDRRNEDRKEWIVSIPRAFHGMKIKKTE